MNTTEAFFSRVQELANEGFKRVSELDPRGFPGGYMCVIYRGDRRILDVGNPKGHEREERWRTNCGKKADRLIANPTHISARQSSDSVAGEYYGGIRVPSREDTIITFSGSYEELDEALCAWIAAQLEGGLNQAQWWEIAGYSGNPHMTSFGQIVPRIAA